SKLVDLSTVGSTSAQIKAYIENEYHTNGIAYVLLVGDAAQVPTIAFQGGSDPSYSLITPDNYPDLFVGRLSAETLAQAATQVERTITYERDILAGQTWPQRGTGVASSEGAGMGHFGESDIVHENQIRTKLLNYGYTLVDQIYDPGASASQVANALNAGRGIVNYTGHGSTTSWSTTGFSNSHVAALTNDNMLPFICSVACVNGNFTSSTCFAEAWLRSTRNGQPIGAVAAYMSTINMSWAPPMDAQDEIVDLMVADQMRTVGGLFFNGSCLMIDRNGATGVTEFKCWTIFGDPSLAVRSKQPEVMTAAHAGALLLGQDTYGVNVPGVPGALCALYADGVLYGSAFTDPSGAATITIAQPPVQPMTLLLTVTAYNKQTLVEDVEVIPASGPYLVIDAVQHVDGNGDGILNAGEAVQMRVRLKNVGSVTAAGINAAISTASEEISITVDTQTFPDIAPAATAWSDGYFAFAIAPGCPDGHAVTMPLEIQGEERLTWQGTIGFVVHAPAIEVADVLVDDTAGGDGNMRLDPGETASLRVTLTNGGSYALNGVTGLLDCNHPQVLVTQDTGAHAGLAPGAGGALAPDFVVSIDPAYPLTEGLFLLEVTGGNGYARLFELRLPIGGFFEPVESGSPGWTHAVVLPGFLNQW
ncbi:MAG: gingipain R, partial [Candidatus Eisenbacteria bacterium]|nr:gingipain R [Candidatus Eisenbacteria bacterium]